MGNSIFKKKTKRKKIDENKEERKISYNCDYYFNEFDQRQQKTISLLLLGTTDSGKSTVLQQIEKLYRGSISNDTLNSAIHCIQQNLLKTIHFLATQNMILKSSHPSCQLTDETKKICSDIISHSCHQFENTPLTTTFAANIAILCQDKGLQETLKICKYRKYQLLDNALYFFEHCDRILHPNYQVTFEDFIRCKRETESIITSEIPINIDENVSNQWTFRLTDVGGHRNQRKQWLRCFTDIHAIIYVMSLVSYDEVIEEHNTLLLLNLFNGYIRRIQQLISYSIPTTINDMCLQYYERQNALTETFEVFDKVMKHESMSAVDAFVFFNKNDLFIPKIKEIPFNVFPDIDTTCSEELFSENEMIHDPDAVKKYLRNKFKQIFDYGTKPQKSPRRIHFNVLPRRIHFHVLSALKTEELQTVMYLVQFETVRKLNLSNTF